jgi:hypothetical protein
VTRLADSPRCSICRAEIGDDGLTLTTRLSARSTVAWGLFCSERCRDAAKALVAIDEAPPGTSSAARRQRGEIADGLLALWRRGAGPEPSLVLLAAEHAWAV